MRKVLRDLAGGSLAQRLTESRGRAWHHAASQGRRHRMMVLATAMIALPFVAGACGGQKSSSGTSSSSTESSRPSRSGHSNTPSPAAPTTSTTLPGTTTVPPTSSSTSTLPTSTTTVLSPAAVVVPKKPPKGTYQVAVPPAWNFADATTPSDHITNVWTSPSTPGQSLTVIASGCIGCVERSLTDRTPDASKVVPAGATITGQPDSYTTDYQAPTLAAGNSDFGRVLILHRGSVIIGYVRLDVVLPSGDQQLASRILQSFTVPSS